MFQQFSESTKQHWPHPHTRPSPGATEGEVHQQCQAIAECVFTHSLSTDHRGNPLRETTVHHEALKRTSGGVVKEIRGCGQQDKRVWSER